MNEIGYVTLPSKNVMDACIKYNNHLRKRRKEFQEEYITNKMHEYIIKPIHKYRIWDYFNKNRKPYKTIPGVYYTREEAILDYLGKLDKKDEHFYRMYSQEYFDIIRTTFQEFSDIYDSCKKSDTVMLSLKVFAKISKFYEETKNVD